MSIYDNEDEYLGSVADPEAALIAKQRMQRQRLAQIAEANQGTNWGQLLADLSLGMGTAISGGNGIQAVQNQMGNRQRATNDRLRALQDQNELENKGLVSLAKIRADQKEKQAGRDWQEKMIPMKSQADMERLVGVEGVKAKFQADLLRNKGDLEKTLLEFKAQQAQEAQKALFDQQRQLEGMRQQGASSRQSVKLERARVEKEPTASQFTAAGFAKRMELAEKELQGLMGSGFNPADPSISYQERFIPGVLESLKPQNTKSYEQIKRNFISSVLRKESGAAISQSEYDSEQKKYYPQGGDSPQVIQQKAVARQQALNNLRAEGSRAYDRISSAEPGSAPMDLKQRALMELQKRKKGK